ncbi:hypothetical protein C5167_046738 [Papaver somniferum]|uniref:Homeobox domain-containing protein n=1 Tax=Papaver somniferum TaxID=3469 RepID=A0A4Y7LEN3_PAPSO|nr:WUSCHEL-related homeobox 2-like [Papaver somniferum]RZC83953.1 hypothetical protein C5167_046738 [Papaver somniferum]
MEDDKSIISSSVFDGTVTGGGSTGGCRWNPTKEQISLLEGLYSQGIRTPSAEQIQEITSKLKVYGHIEGKNVFYWFQNHKARQRQKQKQEQDLDNNIFYYNQFLLHHKSPPRLSPPLFAPPPCNNNGLASAFFIPPLPIPPPQQTFSTPVNSAYYQYPNTKVVVVPPGEVAMRRHVQADDLSSGSTAGYKPVQYRLDGTTMLHAVGGDIVNKSWKEVLGDHTTLDLFPMHPTGILDEKFNYSSTSGNSFSNNTGENNTSSSINSSSDQSCTEEGTTTSLGLHQPFFDFFADHHYHPRCSY